MPPNEGRWDGCPAASPLPVEPTALRWSLRRPSPRSLTRGSRFPSTGARLMSRALRRFEMLLPLRLNDGRPVPPELIAQTLIELRHQFGAVSAETQTIQGSWQHAGQT